MRAGASTPAPKRFCATTGCEQVALVWSSLCAGCDERLRNERTEASCRAKGLVTVEDRRRYCRELLKRRDFGRPGFERWAETITQATVDLIEIQRGEGDLRLLERLRERCVLDHANKVIPVEHRERLRAEREAKLKVERERVEAQLKAQGVVRRAIDTEAA